MNNVAGTVVCDLDGVVYVGSEPVPGAGEALKRIQRAGLALLFATNNASRTPADGARKISDLTGLHVTPDQLITSAMAAASLLDRPALPCFVVGGAGLIEAVEDAGGRIVDDWEQAQVVLTGYTRDLTYSMLRDANLAIRNGARFIASNDDATFPAPNGLWPGAGATVAYLQRASDTSPVIAGKPYQPMRRLIGERVGSGPVWMVGDRPETDLAMAKAEGWTAVLTLTGVVSDPTAVPEELTPDLVIPSIADLPDALGISKEPLLG